MILVTCDALCGELRVAAVQADIRACSDECPDNCKAAVARCQRQWCVESVVVTVNVRVSLGAQECLHRLGVTAAHRIHQGGVSLRGLKLQSSSMVNKTLNNLRVTSHRRIHQSRHSVSVLCVDVARQREKAGNLIGIAVVSGRHQLGLCSLWTVRVFGHV